MEKQKLSFIAIFLISIILAASFVIYKLDLMGPSTPSAVIWQNQILWLLSIANQE